MDDITSAARAGTQRVGARTNPWPYGAWRRTLDHRIWLTLPLPGAGIMVQDVHRQEA
jgi:hypothetical protein